MLHLTATSIGPIAADILATHHELEVLAAFERSFYVMAHGGLVCLGAEEIGRGPINVLLANAEAIDWRSIGLEREVEGEAGGGALSFGEAVRITLADAEPWLPPEWEAFDTDQAGIGLAELARVATGRLGDEGLATLVLADPPVARSPEARAAEAQVSLLMQRLPDLLPGGTLDADTRRALTLLLGLGPGLTPSGDDLIGGVMLGLTALGSERLRDAIWDVLTPELGDLTTEISAMHLSAAADGMAAEVLHETGNAILTGDRRALPRHLERIALLGHSSGWDALAGFALTMRAALRQANAPP